MKKWVILLGVFGAMHGYGQSVNQKIDVLENQISNFEDSLSALSSQIDSLKLIQIAEGLEKMGWPGTEGQIVQHSAMALAYDENYEIARWVTHVISREVAYGNASRTNNFREDPKVTTGTAVEADYFLKYQDANNKTVYDGFGYDRGHIAPSADFRWSPKALSESYYYSNISPQVAEFNREAWANLEANIRQYAIQNNVNLFVVTGPVLSEDLARIDKGINKVAIPKYYYKVALDTLNLNAIGFLMPNEACNKPLEFYVKPIDEIEALTGLDFFANFNANKIDSLEATVNVKGWIGGLEGDFAALNPSVLGKNQINTIQAYDHVGTNKNVEVCGTVAGTHKSKKGNIFINLDKQFPNAVFTLTIWSRVVENFSYAPEIDLKSKRVCAYGKVTQGSKTLEMNIQSEKQISVIEDFETEIH